MLVRKGFIVLSSEKKTAGIAVSDLTALKGYPIEDFTEIVLTIGRTVGSSDDFMKYRVSLHCCVADEKKRGVLPIT